MHGWQLRILLIVLANYVFIFLLNNLDCFAFLRMRFLRKTMQILHYLFELVRDGRDFLIFASIVVLPGRRRRLFLTRLSLSRITV